MTVIVRIADRGPFGIAATAPSRRRTKGVTTTMYPVKTMRHICIPNDKSAQNPSPQKPMQCQMLDSVSATAVANTMSVRRQAITKELGIQRIDQRVNPSAARSRNNMRIRCARLRNRQTPIRARNVRVRPFLVPKTSVDCRHLTCPYQMVIGGKGENYGITATN